MSMYEQALKEYMAMLESDNPTDRKKHHDKMIQNARSVQAGAPAKSAYVPYSDPGEPIPVNKQEFLRFRQKQPVTDDSACRGARFTLSAPQLFLRNLVSPYTPYNGVLLFHGVGVGKTCSAIQIAEGFRAVFPKKALVLGPTNLVQGFKTQVFDPSRGTSQCTGDLYMSSLASTVATSPADVTYEFMGYQKFANHVHAVREGLAHDEAAISRKLGNEFSNRVIIIDEVQNLRKLQNQNKGVSRAMESILAVAENTKLVLLTATPLYNDVDELRFLMELLYLNDKKFVHAAKIRKLHLAKLPLTSEVRGLLADFAAGYVSYVRGDSPATFPIRLWPTHVTHPSKLPKLTMDGQRVVAGIKHLQLYCSELSQNQQSLYESVTAGKVPIEESEEDQDSQMVDEVSVAAINSGLATTTLNQICDIVYPDGKYGSSGFNSSFRNVKMGEGIKYEYMDGNNQFLHESKIGEYSGKFQKLIQLLKKAKGVVLVYSRFVYGCLLPLALALEHAGFSNYSGNLLTGNVKKERVDQVQRYALLIAEANAIGSTAAVANRAKIIQQARQPKNMNGQVIKVILFSGAAAEGTDFRFARELHVIDPWHNLSRIGQIVGRGVRNCSHSLLPAADRNCTIYLHAATTKNGRETCDVMMYRESERKQLLISGIERILKEHSVDCNLNRPAFQYPDKTVTMDTSQGESKVVQVGDKDFSQACDFDKCNYKCAITEPQAVDTSTDDINFMYLEPYKMAMAQLFENRVSATYEQMLAAAKNGVSTFEYNVFMHAINSMVTDKYEVSYKHLPGFLIYQSNRYIFQPLNQVNQKITLSQRSTTQTTQTRVDRVRVPKLKNTSVSTTDAVTNVQQLARELVSIRKGLNYEVCMDYALDHASHGEYTAAAVAALRGEAPDILKSLERGHAVFSDAVFDHFAMRYVNRDAQYLALYSDRKTRIAHAASIESFIASSKRTGVVVPIKGKVLFKLIQQKHRMVNKIHGVVCDQFSQLRTEDLVKMVQSLQDWQGGNRKDTCMLYELALRLQRECLRPAEAYFYARKDRKQIQNKTI